MDDYLAERENGTRRKNILVIDDDVMYLRSIHDWLSDRYSVTMMNSAASGITYLAKNKTDLILLDYERPVTSGPEVLKMLRSDEDTKRIPVFFLTGRSDKESVMNVMAYKPEGYILKTVEKNELLEKLNDFFMTRQ